MSDVNMPVAPLVAHELIDGIKAYCEKRNYKCGGCRYSMRKHYEQMYGIPYKGKWMTCMFANCPTDWEREYMNEYCSDER